MKSLAAALLWLSCAAVLARADAPTCAELAGRPVGLGPRAQFAKDVAGYLAGELRATREELARCPDVEPLWYRALRLAELGGPHLFPLQFGGVDAKSLRDAAAAAASRFPRSARIATVLARADGSVPAARSALGIDPSYAPAQVALGAALLQTGDAKGARDVLEKVGALDRVVGGWATLARARTATADYQQGIEAAEREERLRNDRLLEPASEDYQRRFRWEALGVESEAQLKLGQADKATRSLLRSAALGSADARDRLRTDAALRRYLKPLSKDRSLAPFDRELARDLAAAPSPRPEP